MKFSFIFVCCTLPLCIIVFGFSIGYTLTVHPALAVVTVMLLCVGSHYLYQAIINRKDKRIQRRLEQVFQSIAAIPAGETWRLEVTINRLELFVLNPWLPFLILMLSIQYNPETRDTAVAGFCIFFLFCYVMSIALNLPGLKSKVLVLSDEGIETFWNGFIPWTNIKNIEVNIVTTSKGGKWTFFNIYMANPSTLTKHHWKDRFLGLFHLGAKKNGVLFFSLDYASEDYEVVCTTANALMNKKKRYSKSGSQNIRRSEIR